MVWRQMIICTGEFYRNKSPGHAFHEQNSHGPGNTSMVYTGKDLHKWKECGEHLKKRCVMPSAGHTLQSCDCNDCEKALLMMAELCQHMRICTQQGHVSTSRGGKPATSVRPYAAPAGSHWGEAPGMPSIWKSFNSSAFVQSTICHSRQILFECRICGWAFLTAVFFTHHMRVLMERSPECNECGKDFTFSCFLWGEVTGSTLGKPFRVKNVGEPFVTVLP